MVSELLAGTLAIACAIAAIYAGVAAGRRWRSKPLGWTIGLISYALLYLATLETRYDLARHACKGAEDFRACVSDASG